MNLTVTEICKLASERRAYILANPDQFTSEQVALAKLAQYQLDRLEPAAILRYGD